MSSLNYTPATDVYGRIQAPGTIEHVRDIAVKALEPFREDVLKRLTEAVEGLQNSGSADATTLNAVFEALYPTPVSVFPGDTFQKLRSAVGDSESFSSLWSYPTDFLIRPVSDEDSESSLSAEHDGEAVVNLKVFQLLEGMAKSALQSYGLEGALPVVSYPRNDLGGSEYYFPAFFPGPGIRADDSGRKRERLTTGLILEHLPAHAGVKLTLVEYPDPDGSGLGGWNIKGHYRLLGEWVPSE
ncbi:hypothetical protein ACUH93_00510 [Dermabacteraceae bacterium P7006]